MHVSVTRVNCFDQRFAITPQHLADQCAILVDLHKYDIFRQVAFTVTGSVPLNDFVFTIDGDDSRLIHAHRIESCRFADGYSIQAGKALYFFQPGAPV